jgi:hypothetical protein
MEDDNEFPDVTPEALRIHKPAGAKRAVARFLDEKGEVWCSEELPSYMTRYWQVAMHSRILMLGYAERNMGFLAVSYRVEWV